MLLLFFSIGSRGQNIEFAEYDLENGLHVILQHDQTMPIVSIGVMYDLGTSSEPSGKRGISKVMEKLMFGRMAHVKKGQYQQLLDENGGRYVSDIGSNYSFYGEVLPSNLVNLGLWLESERMYGLVISEKDLAKAKEEVMKEGYAQQFERTQLEQVALNQMTFQSPNYRYEGHSQFYELDSINIDDVREYADNFIKPSHATLVLSGMFDFNDVQVKINRYFATLGQDRVEAFRPYEDYAVVKNVDTLLLKNDQMRSMTVAWKIPIEDQRVENSLYYLTKVMAEGTSSRLHKLLVNEHELANEVKPCYHTKGDYAVFGVNVNLRNGGESRAALDIIDEVVQDLKDNYITDEEVEISIYSFENEWVRSLQRGERVAKNMAYSYLFKGDANRINTIGEEILETSIDDIVDASRKYLLNSNRMVLYVMPE